MSKIMQALHSEPVLKFQIMAGLAALALCFVVAGVYRLDQLENQARKEMKLKVAKDKMHEAHSACRPAGSLRDRD